MSDCNVGRLLAETAGDDTIPADKLIAALRADGFSDEQIAEFQREAYEAGAAREAGEAR